MAERKPNRLEGPRKTTLNEIRTLDTMTGSELALLTYAKVSSLSGLGFDLSERPIYRIYTQTVIMNDQRIDIPCDREDAATEERFQVITADEAAQDTQRFGSKPNIPPGMLIIKWQSSGLKLEDPIYPEPPLYVGISPDGITRLGSYIHHGSPNSIQEWAALQQIRHAFNYPNLIPNSELSKPQ
jgi:hypothetical protein